MKKTYVLLAFAFLLVSCNKDEINDLTNSVNSLKDSLQTTNDKYLSLLDSIMTLESTDTIDIKSIKMLAIGSLFESVARQPEAYKSMINATKMLYKDYTELLPLSDKYIFQRGKARGIVFGKLFESVARQPEAAFRLDSIAELFLGKYNSAIICDEMSNYTKGYAIPKLIESIARQPEAEGDFNAMSLKYLNVEFIH